MNSVINRRQLWPAIFKTPIKIDKNHHLLINNLHRNIIVVNNDLYNKFIENQFSNLDDQTIQKLIDNHFLYNEKNGEHNQFINWFRKCQYNNHSINLIILTTTSCNLQCEYCYELEQFRYSSKLSKFQINQIIHFLEKAISFYGYKEINIVFYGGEPLLNDGAIIQLINDLSFDLRFEGIKKSYGMFTNGTLLNSRHIELINYYFNFITISIDISFDNPNEKRLFKNGSSSFSVTLENIKKLDKNFKGKLSLSIVIDHQNYTDINNFFNILIKNGLGHIYINISLANPTIKNFYQHTNQCFALFAEHYHIIRYCHQLAKEVAIKTNFMQVYNSGPCMLRRKNHLIVTPDGKLTKCIGLLGKDLFSLEKLSHVNQDIEKFDGELNNLLETLDFWNNKKCHNCEFLPLCLGGCRYLSYFKNKNYRQPFCHADLIKKTDLLLIKDYMLNDYKG